MSMIQVPSLGPGERSLPAELRTRRGAGFAARRLRNGMRGVSGWGMGDDTSSESGDTSGDTSGIDFTPIDLPSSSGTLPTDNIFTAPAPEVPATGALPGLILSTSADGGTSVLPTTAQTGGDFVQAPPNYSAPSGYPTTYPTTSQPPAAPSGYQWVQAANGAALNLAKVLAISQGGTVMQLPNGQQIISGAPGANVGVLSSSGIAGSISSYLPYILLIGGAFLLMNMSRNR